MVHLAVLAARRFGVDALELFDGLRITLDPAVGVAGTTLALDAASTMGGRGFRR
jgi:hypothetical protein